MQISNKIKINLNEILITLQLSFLAFGNIGGALAPIRLVAIFVALFAFRRLSRNFFLRNFKVATSFFVLFYLFLAISLLWTSNAAEGLKEIIYYLFHILIFYNIIILSHKSNRSHYAICLGWVIAVLLTLPIAFREIIFDQHLSISVHEAGELKNFGEGVIAQRIFASATFGNFNAYVTFLGFALPFVIAYIFLARKSSQTLLGLFLLISISTILIINASRGGLISLVIAILGGFYFYIKSNKPYKLTKLFILISSLACGVIYYYEILTFQIGSRLFAASIFEDQSRSKLLSSTLDLLSSSYFIGSGIGSLETEYKSLRIHEINVPHNFLVEFFVQYGIIFGIFLLIILIKIFITGIKSKNLTVCFVAYVGFAILPFIGLVNSTYLLSPMFWCYIASIVSFVNVSKFK